MNRRPRGFLINRGAKCQLELQGYGKFQVVFQMRGVCFTVHNNRRLWGTVRGQIITAEVGEEGLEPPTSRM